MDPIDEQKVQDTVSAAMKRWQASPRVDHLLLKPYEGWCLLSGIHLVLRHPELTLDLRLILTRIGRRLQALVADTLELNDIAERGWSTEHDVDRHLHPVVLLANWHRLVWMSPQLNSVDRRVALSLGLHVSPDEPREAALSVRRLAEMTECGEPAVRQAIAHLIDLGLIIPVPGDQPGLVSAYRLVMPADPITLTRRPEEQP